MKRWFPIAVAGVLGCGSAPAAERSPEQPSAKSEEHDQRPAMTIEDALRDFDKSEQALNRGVASKTSPAPPPPTSVPPTSVPPTSASPPSTEPKPQMPRPGVTPNGPGIEESSPCEIACVALESMRRSSKRLCELTGDDDQRCVTARERVGRGETRVREVCGACNAPAAIVEPVRASQIALSLPLSEQVIEP